MRTLSLLLLIPVLLLSSLLSIAITIEEVPNPKDTGAYYVSDPDHLLTEKAINQLNRMLWQLENTSEFQAAVVILNDLGDQEPKDFATRLFNYWGIGKSNKDNGFLLLVAMSQRRMEIETGYGTETVLPDVACFNIQQEYMVPLFKEGNYEQGILDGMDKVVEVLSNPESVATLKEMEKDEDTGAARVLFNLICAIFFIAVFFTFFATKRKKLFSHQGYKLAIYRENEPRIAMTWWLTLYVFIPLITFWLVNTSGDYRMFFESLYFIVLAYLIESRIRHNIQINRLYSDDYSKYVMYKKAHSFIGLQAFIFPVPFLFYLLFYKYRQKKLRNAPKVCHVCASNMKKLDESTDDDYLNKGQVMEEELESVDYDVWICESCDNTLVLKYEGDKAKYEECDSCKFKTSYLESRKTIKAATYSSAGTGVKTYRCKNCGHVEKETFEIPKKQSSSSSSSSSSGSGSSFGGGSSGGGGAGSSW